jgi:sugar-specific transcriptional regulator TrmB/DNA-binding CsgD family transcriptional regulator
VALEILGLDGLSEAVYRALLADPEPDLGDVAGRLGVAESEVRAAIGRLVELSLVSERAPGRVYVPVSPDVALEALLSLEQAELSRRERRLLEARAELARLVHDDRAERVRRVHRLDDVEQVKEVLRELALRCYQETISVTSGPPTAEAQLADGLRYDLGLIERGVRLRLLYTRSQLESEPMRRYVRTVAKAGAEVRVAETLPHRLVVFDRAVSFLPLDPLRPSRGALVVREPAITANLVILFESLWAAAAEVDQALEAGAPAASELDRAVLLLMSSGVKDEAAARQLNVSDRTYRRHVADIMVRLGASSRFQAGVEAVRRGWL